MTCSGEHGRALSAIVVDDERLARSDLISMLKEHEGIVVVGQAADTRAAGDLIAKLNPDVVFLDIQMPGESGFDLLDRMDIKSSIIFVTAYDEHAVRAFEVNALDYLLKPVSKERLASSVKRLLEPERGERGERGETAEKDRLRYDDSLFLRIDDGMKFLKVSTISAVRAAGDYTEVMTSGRQGGLTSKSMKEWEARLPPDRFCRIHRSTIINLECVERVEDRGNYTFDVFLRGMKEPFAMSRRYSAALKHRLE